MARNTVAIKTCCKCCDWLFLPAIFTTFVLSRLVKQPEHMKNKQCFFSLKMADAQ